MTDQFVSLPYDLIHGKSWLKLSYSARCLYVAMRGAVYKRNKSGKVENHVEDRVRFGNADMPGMHTETYMNGILELRIAGLIELLEPGKFPRRKGLYLFSDKWKKYQMMSPNEEPHREVNR